MSVFGRRMMLNTLIMRDDVGGGETALAADGEESAGAPDAKLSMGELLRTLRDGAACMMQAGPAADGREFADLTLDEILGRCALPPRPR